MVMASLLINEMRESTFFVIPEKKIKFNVKLFLRAIYLKKIYRLHVSEKKSLYIIVFFP